MKTGDHFISENLLIIFHYTDDTFEIAYQKLRSQFLNSAF